MQDLIKYLIKEAGLEAHYTYGAEPILKPGVSLSEVAPDTKYLLTYDSMGYCDMFEDHLVAVGEDDFCELLKSYRWCVPVSEHAYYKLGELSVSACIDYDKIAEVLNKYLVTPKVSFSDGVTSTTTEGVLELQLPIDCSDEIESGTYEDLHWYSPHYHESVTLYVTEDFKEMFDKPIPKTDWSKLLK